MADISSTISAIISTTSAFSMDLNLFQSEYLWAVIVGFILAFTLGAGMGANDVSNAFGTSVGSKVLTVIQAYILATIMESLGAILLGYNVADTIRKGVIDVSLYADDPRALMLGQIAILGAGTCWLLIATLCKLPVSTTHSIVGATIGFSFMVKGTEGIKWGKVAEIAASWVISPLFSGTISMLMYLFLDFAVLRRSNPLRNGYIVLPFFFFFIFFLNAVAILVSGSKVLGLSGLSTVEALIGSVIVGVVAALLAQFALKPWLKNWVEKKYEKKVKAAESVSKISVIVLNDKGHRISVGTLGAEFNSASSEAKVIPVSENSRKQEFELSWCGFWKWLIPYQHRLEDSKTLIMFSSLQVFTACFAGFAHGANDVSNAIAPIAAMMSIYKDLNVQQTASTPLYILFFGTFSVCVGLWLLGHRVIKTIGDDVTEVNPASGFIIELGAAVTAMIASKLGLPISTTHALVGSVVGVGMIKSGSGVDWKVFRNIVSSWVVTLPASALISAGIMFLLGFAM